VPMHTSALACQSPRAASRALARALDPVEDIRTESSEPRTKGHYRRQMIAAPRDGIWGTDAGTCGTAVLVRRRPDGSLEINPTLCDAWACPFCGVRKAAWFKRELHAAQVRHHLNTFLTLTVNTNSVSAAASASRIKEWWHTLHVGLSRDYGHSSYVWAHEHTQRGWSHLHLLTTLELEPSALSTRWRHVTGDSFIVDVQPVESDRASDYLAKYCTEQATLRATPEYAHMVGKRFYSTSRDIRFQPFRNGRNPDEGASPWTRIPIPYHEIVARLRAKDAEVTQRLAVVPGCAVQAEGTELAALFGGKP
jgi:hypothetical protein